MTTSHSSTQTPVAVDSISTPTAADKVVQLKKHWNTGAADTLFTGGNLEALCLALNSRGPGNKSRLDYVLRAEGAFADPHARACVLSFLLHDYASRRAGSAVANEKWVLAKKGLFALRESLPQHLQNAPIFGKLEGTSDARPRKSASLSWRDL